MGSMRVLVLGASGMLGNAMMRLLAQSPGLVVAGAVRSYAGVPKFAPEIQHRLIPGVDVEQTDALIRVFERLKPDVVINCVGVVKQKEESADPLVTVPINALLPHRLLHLCGILGARLVHISTDCVFSGAKGMYVESDNADAQDLYGRSKLLGELVDSKQAITLRTSIIGHELRGNQSLVEWFLSQKQPVRGYRRAVFSGLPTVELARVVRDYVIPNPGLNGLYHVSAAPIAKYDLLRLVARQYGKEIEIEPDDQVVIDRSLDSELFRRDAGYQTASWPELIRQMHQFG